MLFSFEPSMIMNFMDSIFDTVFNLSKNPSLQEWGNEVISDMAERTENQVNDQLGK